MSDLDDDFRSTTADFDGIDTADFRKMEKAYYKAAQERHAAQEEINNKARAAMAMPRAEWNPLAYEKETDQQRQQFDAFAKDRDKKERDRVEAENALGFIAANPRYVPSPSNSQNIAAYLRQNELEA
jgi:hypothetical protein